MRQRILWAVSLGFLALGACAGSDEEAVSEAKGIPQEGPVSVTLLTGEVLEVDASKICWDTLTAIPEGHKVVPDVKANRMRFVPENADTRSATREEIIAEESGGVTCTCSSGSGGCSPAKVGSTVGCVMTSCSNCTKS